MNYELTIIILLVCILIALPVVRVMLNKSRSSRLIEDIKAMYEKQMSDERERKRGA